jgi:GPN-loop GTPase
MSFLRIHLYQLVVVNLIDSYCCTDPALYVSALLLCLKTMLQMEFPFINVLSKIDLLSQYAPLGTVILLQAKFSF